MRIDPNSTVAGYPRLVIRRTLRRLRGRLSWRLADLEAAAALKPGEGHALAEALRAARLIERARRGAWVITQAGQTFSSATAAKPITRVTAERSLAQFLERVKRVEQDPYFLATVTRVVLFGSMLNPEVLRLSDVDVAVELVPKEADYDLVRALNRRRVEELARQGRQFRNFLEVERWCGDLRVSEGAKSRDRFGRLRSGEFLHFSCTTPSSNRQSGANFPGESAHADATAAESASAGITVLSEWLPVAQELAVKIHSSAFSASDRFFQVGDDPLGGSIGRVGASAAFPAEHLEK